MARTVERRPARRLLAAASACGFAAAAVAFASAPARAEDDGQGSVFNSLLSIVGLEGKSDPAAPKIDYRERAPLVLPKTMALPPPAQSAERNPAWPKDPDVLAQRRAAQEARAPAHYRAPNRAKSWEAMRNDRPDPRMNQPREGDNCEMYEHQCDPAKLWASLRIKKGDPGAIQNGPKFLPGKEPPRKYLTDPPPGYRTPTQLVKRTWDAPKNREADDNSNVYWLKQAGQKVSEDDPTD